MMTKCIFGPETEKQCTPSRYEECRRCEKRGIAQDISVPSVENSWAKVELYRWQHGELPQKQCKDLDISEALNKMGDAMLENPQDSEKWPSPFNIAHVLKYLSQLKIEEQSDDPSTNS